MALPFTDKEFSLLSNAEIIHTKRRAQAKVFTLLEETQLTQAEILKLEAGNLPEEITHFSGKISKGENYQGLPYMILDYPAYFTKAHIFAYRTMFFWGHFFSFTLHLQGQYLSQYRQSLYAGAETLIDAGVYISTNTTPWHYTYTPGNYTLLTVANKTKILEDPFLKLSKRLPLDQWQDLPQVSANYLQTLLAIITQSG